MPSSLALSLKQHIAALRVLLVLTVILGFLYPLAVTGVAQLITPGRANGSLVSSDGKTVGSKLIGQLFTDDKGNALPQWFQSRPSAAGKGYDPTATGASNLGPENSDLLKAVQDRRAAAAALDGVAPGSVPPDALTASGSGLDPDISPAYAYQQVARIAKARNLDVAKVRALVADRIQSRQLGFLGERVVNVVELNLALESLSTGR